MHVPGTEKHIYGYEVGQNCGGLYSSLACQDECIASAPRRHPYAIGSEIFTLIDSSDGAFCKFMSRDLNLAFFTTRSCQFVESVEYVDSFDFDI